MNSKICWLTLTILLDYVCLILLPVAHHKVLLQTGRVQVLLIAAKGKWEGRILTRQKCTWTNSWHPIKKLRDCPREGKKVLGFSIWLQRPRTKTYLLVMDLQVLLQVGARGELFVADLADIGFFPRVDPLMPDQVWYLWIDSSYFRKKWCGVENAGGVTLT